MHSSTPIGATRALAVAVALALLGPLGCAGTGGGGGYGSRGSGGYDAGKPGQSRLTRYAFKAEAPSNRATGERLPAEEGALALVGADGRPVRIADYAGRTLVLVFTRGFAGYICPYCTTYTAQIATRYPELVAAGAEVLLVYPTAEEGVAKVDDFRAAVDDILREEGRAGLPFPVFLDPGLKVVRSYRIEGDLSRPSTFVLDASGMVRYAYVGQALNDRPSVERILTEVRAAAGG